MQGRGGKGVLTIQYDRRRGKLVGALIVELDTEVYAITSGGGVIRTLAREVRKAKRQTMGVRLMNLSEGDSLVAIARNADAEPVEDGRYRPVRRRRSRRRTDRLDGLADGAILVTATSGPGSPTASPARSARRRVRATDGPMAAPQHVGPAGSAARPRVRRARRRGPGRRTPAGPRRPAGRRGWRRCSSSGSTRGRC